ncbi:SDR family oxidoreductase [Echinimonas agarilytica]|uniref:SDR family oxidoreductase n=1 Tax=Echinimonas agarilytica TaxID=1215918 RepID=A0AA42B6V4_9GAMM|nr:SDR family oxidoreductase [Echinimonas agarilytica]MCM2679105.1 SDR family oxidoreductase [Echinimonas agarilytica]
MSQTVVITGANRGLGLEFCRYYLNRGDNVIACCRHPSSASELDELKLDFTKHISIHALDITKEAQHRGFIAALGRTKIDILINNAGIYGSKGLAIEQIGADEWSHVLQVNAISPMLFTRNLKNNLNKNAKIVFVTSKMGSIGDNSSGGSYMYRSSKAALNAAAHSLAVDWAELSFNVAILHPGWVKTDMGGPNALITAVQSVTGMCSVIEGLDSDDSGQFINYDSQPIPWQ